VTPGIRVAGEWSGAAPANVEAVARSVADSFDVFEDEHVSIVLEPVAGEDDPPITLFAPNELGEIVVRLNVRGNLWARLAYQFAHELCHVIADPATFELDRFTWIEEALCETGSLFALRRMATTWATDPPYPNWSDYAPALAGYAAERMRDPAHCLPPGEPFAQWLSERLPSLESNPGLRAEATVVAGQFLPIFERDRTAWRALRYLHASPRDASLREFMHRWSNACPPPQRRAVDAIAGVLAAPDATRAGRSKAEGARGRRGSR
jgi:hypothetical protein